MSESSHGPENYCLTIPIENVRCRDAGLLQPSLVRPAGDGSYDVIDSACRLVALREPGVPELILGRDVLADARETEADVRFKHLIPNVQREELNDIERWQAFMTLKEEYGYQYNEIAETPQECGP